MATDTKKQSMSMCITTRAADDEEDEDEEEDESGTRLGVKKGAPERAVGPSTEMSEFEARSLGKEAMSSGIPVVVADKNETSIVQHRSTGFRAHPDSSTQFIE